MSRSLQILCIASARGAVSPPDPTTDNTTPLACNAEFRQMAAQAWKLYMQGHAGEAGFHKRGTPTPAHDYLNVPNYVMSREGLFVTGANGTYSAVTSCQ